MLRAVLFDLDGTILDRASSLRVYLHQQARRLPEVFETVSFGEYVDTFLALDGNGYVERPELFRKLERVFPMSPGMGDALLVDYQTYFPDVCVPFPGAHPTLSLLREQGLGLGLVTNGRVASQQPKIDGLGIARYFHTILISEAEGVRKPDPQIFRRAIDALGVSPEEAVMVGDNPETDIGGAKSFGMKAIWKRDEAWEPPAVVDAVIDELGELPQAISDLS